MNIKNITKKVDKDGYEVKEYGGVFTNWLGHRVPANEVEEVDLTGRFAKCSYCGKLEPSTNYLAFFRHHKHLEYDEYYCGCRGWD